MEKVNTLYEACVESLWLLSNMIDSDLDSVAYSREILKFLTNENSKYDNLLSEITYVDLAQNKLLYKKLMMLIITSGSYYFALYNLDNKIEEEYYERYINYLESKDYKDIIEEFLNCESEELDIFDYINEYAEFSNNGDLFFNKCKELVLKYNKLDKITKINPFEIVNFINYVDPKSILITSKLIQDFIDIYRSSDYITKIDEKGNSLYYKDRFEYLRATIDKQMFYKYGDKEKVKRVYSYIFANVYENMTLYYDIDKRYMQNKYNLLAKEFESDNINFDTLFKKYVQDRQFFAEVINFFLTYNDNLYFNELSERRNEFEQKGNVKILKKLNPFYEIESIYFKKVKNSIKNEL